VPRYDSTIHWRIRPLKDIHNTTKISEVFLAGKEFGRPALDQVPGTAEAAAKGTSAQ
jgi:hypothetical protein